MLFFGTQSWFNSTNSKHVVQYLAGHSVGAELAEAQGGLDPPEESYHVQVLDPTPGGNTSVTLYMQV